MGIQLDHIAVALPVSCPKDKLLVPYGQTKPFVWPISCVLDFVFRINLISSRDILEDIENGWRDVHHDVHQCQKKQIISDPVCPSCGGQGLLPAVGMEDHPYPIGGLDGQDGHTHLVYLLGECLFLGWGGKKGGYLSSLSVSPQLPKATIPPGTT